MKKLFFSLAVIIGVSGAYGKSGQPFHKPYLQPGRSVPEQNEGRTVRLSLRILPPLPGREQRMSTPEGAHEFNEHFMRGVALYAMMREGISLGDDNEAYSDLFLFYNSIFPPADQIQEIISRSSPGNLADRLAFRVEVDREDEYARVIMDEALRVLSEEEQAVFMSRLGRNGTLARLGR